MGERAVAAVTVDDATFWYRSQWGGSRQVLDAVFDAPSPLQELLDGRWQYLGSHPLSGAADVIDFQTTEVVYLVTAGGVAVYLPLWFGLADTPRALPENGVLVPGYSARALRRCRRALRRLKGAILDALDARTLTREGARALLARVRELVRALVQFHPVPNVYTGERNQGGA